MPRHAIQSSASPATASRTQTRTPYVQKLPNVEQAPGVTQHVQLTLNLLTIAAAQIPGACFLHVESGILVMEVIHFLHKGNQLPGLGQLKGLKGLPAKPDRAV